VEIEYLPVVTVPENAEVFWGDYTWEEVVHCDGHDNPDSEWFGLSMIYQHTQTCDKKPKHYRRHSGTITSQERKERDKAVYLGENYNPQTFKDS
jgi:hypothetical protein